MNDEKELLPYRPLPLGSIVLDDAYCKNALAKEEKYLLSLENGRLLAGFYQNAGISTRFVRYGGWENKLIAGHAVGHILSALAQACANGGVQAREALSRKLRALVSGLKTCQDALGTGFLWAAPPIEGGVEAQFDHVEAGKTNILTQAWVPWYTMHKLLAGLIDAFVLAHCETAREVAVKLGDWVADRVLRWDAETQRRVLAVEYGGMNDALYELYALTHDERHARAAHCFDEEPLFDLILTEGKDVLNDRHANTTIPKILGALKRYLTFGEPRYLRVAEAFFRMVVERHTYATGGNSEWEHFGRDYILDAERTNCNCETCNVYNMLKMARLLFCVTGDKRYPDYYDNAFTNSILSSQNPETGMTTYFQPMAGGFFKVFSEPYTKFWCCTGSGMESFTKLGDSAVYRRGRAFYLEQYLSMHVSAEDGAFSVACDLPWDEDVTLSVAAGAFPLFLRIPDWAAGMPEIERDGVRVDAPQENGHLRVDVAAGDRLTVRIPRTVSARTLPDAPDTAAFCYGGAVLSADLGCEDMRTTETGVDVTIPARRILPSERIYTDSVQDVLQHPERYLRREGRAFRFVGGDLPLRFGLHYRRYRERYAIYWKICAGERTAEAQKREPIDTVQPGYGQYETDALHALRECDSVSETAEGTSRRAEAGGWFEYDMRVDADRANVLSVGLRRADNYRPLTIEVGGELLFRGTLIDTMGEEDLYRREFLIPQETIARAVRTKEVRGERVSVVPVRFSGDAARASVRISEFIFIYPQET